MNLLELNSRSQQIVKLLCTTAARGLADCYSLNTCPTAKHISSDNHVRLSQASNLRYIIMAQIGIKRWLNSDSYNTPDDRTSLPDLWPHISSESHRITGAGNLGLAIWASVQNNSADYITFTEKLVDNWARLREACNAVELAWVLQGLVRFSQHQPVTNKIANVLDDVHNRLMDLYCRDNALFARHNRSGLTEVISSRIACFADQVYPILALANYGRHFNNQQSIDTAAAVADTICGLQGPDGQWWWQYDVKTGQVAEEYPVFSVHQDGMAPMALLAIDTVAGTNHTVYVEKGLAWLDKRNELNVEMILPEQGIIYRDIHRREIGKMYRLVRGLLITAGWETAHCLAGKNLFGYVLNRECRPYELGWILYAWADFHSNSSSRLGH